MKDKEGIVRFHIGGVSYGSTLIKAAVFSAPSVRRGKRIRHVEKTATREKKKRKEEEREKTHGGKR